MDLDLSRISVFPSEESEVVRYLREGMPALLDAVKNLAAVQQSSGAVPVKAGTGDMRFADGSGWDPGFGKGLYLYNGTSWFSESGVYDACAYGAVGDGVTDNRVAIQTAINAASAAGGGVVTLPPGTFLVSKVSYVASSGTYPCGLHVPANVMLRGAGSRQTTIKAANQTDMNTVVALDEDSICLAGFTLDGNNTLQNNSPRLATFNLLAARIAGFYIDDVYSLNACGGGLWFVSVSKMFGSRLRTSETTADCCHLQDCHHVTLDGVQLDGTGDDGFVIEATHADSYNITVKGLIVSVPVTTGSAGRGVFLFSDHANSGAQRNIYNIKIDAITHGCKNQALVLNDANFYNLDIRILDYGSGGSAYLLCGSATYAGSMYTSHFDIQSWQPDNAASSIPAIYARTTGGFIRDNRISAQIYNPSDGYSAIDLAGDKWFGQVQVRYNPLSTKVNQKQGLELSTTNSIFHVMASQAANNIYFTASAKRNTIYLSRIDSPTSYGLNFQTGADDNKIIGGYLDGPVLNNGARNGFYGTYGADAYGAVSISPDANGNGTIAHTLVAAPTTVRVSLRGDNANEVNVESVDATNITVRIRNTTTNADVAAGTFTVDWTAKL